MNQAREMYEWAKHREREQEIRQFNAFIFVGELKSNLNTNQS